MILLCKWKLLSKIYFAHSKRLNFHLQMKKQALSVTVDQDTQVLRVKPPLMNVLPTNVTLLELPNALIWTTNLNVNVAKVSLETSVRPMLMTALLTHVWMEDNAEMVLEVLSANVQKDGLVIDVKTQLAFANLILVKITLIVWTCFWTTSVCKYHF